MSLFFETRERKFNAFDHCLSKIVHYSSLSSTNVHRASVVTLSMLDLRQVAVSYPSVPIVFEISVMTSNFESLSFGPRIINKDNKK